MDNISPRSPESRKLPLVIFALSNEYTSRDHLRAQKFYNDTDREVTFTSIPFTAWMNDLYQ